jgi:hypothetical protein
MRMTRIRCDRVLLSFCSLSVKEPFTHQRISFNPAAAASVCCRSSKLKKVVKLQFQRARDMQHVQQSGARFRRIPGGRASFDRREAGQPPAPDAGCMTKFFNTSNCGGVLNRQTVLTVSSRLLILPRACSQPEFDARTRHNSAGWVTRLKPKTVKTVVCFQSLQTPG